MLLLAIDTAHHTCSIALAEDQHILTCETDHTPAQQAETLFSLVDAAFRSTDHHYKDLHAIAVSIGPGSFTGIRIGVAAARGMALATGLPLIGITTLEATAWQAHSNSQQETFPIVSVMDARRNQLYIQSFDSDIKQLSQPELIDITLPLHLPRTTFIISGSGTPLLTPVLQHAKIDFLPFTPATLPDAATVAAIASQRYPSCDNANKNVQPLYIRKPDAKKPGNCVK